MASSEQKKVGKFIGKVKNGPSKLELIMALSDNPPRKVYFTFQGMPVDIITQKVKVVITRAGRAINPSKSSSARWIIDGHILGTSISFMAVYFPDTRYGEFFYARDWRVEYLL